MTAPEHQEHNRYTPIAIPRPAPDDNWPYRSHPATPNDPQYGIKAPKFERHLFIRRDQLLFDIDAQLSIIADARKNDDGTTDDTVTNATNKYKQLFYRWIERYIGEAKTIISAFVLEKFRETAMNAINDNDEVDITLLMPEWYDDTTYQQLCDKLHEYVVSATLYEFCKMRFTSKDPVTVDMETQKQDANSSLRALSNMSKPNRISKPYNPF